MNLDIGDSKLGPGLLTIAILIFFYILFGYFKDVIWPW